jgi:hypothetical protein
MMRLKDRVVVGAGQPAAKASATAAPREGAKVQHAAPWQ